MAWSFIHQQFFPTINDFLFLLFGRGFVSYNFIFFAVLPFSYTPTISYTVLCMVFYTRFRLSVILPVLCPVSSIRCIHGFIYPLYVWFCARFCLSVVCPVLSIRCILGTRRSIQFVRSRSVLVFSFLYYVRIQNNIAYIYLLYLYVVLSAIELLLLFSGFPKTRHICLCYHRFGVR